MWKQHSKCWNVTQSDSNDRDIVSLRLSIPSLSHFDHCFAVDTSVHAWFHSHCSSQVDCFVLLWEGTTHCTLLYYSISRILAYSLTGRYLTLSFYYERETKNACWANIWRVCGTLLHKDSVMDPFLCFFLSGLCGFTPHRFQHWLRVWWLHTAANRCIWWPPCSGTVLVRKGRKWVHRNYYCWLQ